MTPSGFRLSAVTAACWLGVAGCSDQRNPTSIGEASLRVNQSAPLAPSALTAVATAPGQITVSWTDNSDNEIAFEVHGADAADGVFILNAELGMNVTTASFSGLGYTVTRCYKVRAVAIIRRKTRVTSEFSNVACATTAERPLEAPSGTAAAPTGSTVIGLRWVDNSPDEDGFRIERAASASCSPPWELVASVGPNVTSFVDVDRLPEQWLCYRVIAFRESGTVSPPSPVATAVPLAAPTNIVATALDHRSIRVEWTDNSSFESGYEIHRASSAGGPYQLVGWTGESVTGFLDGGLTSSTTYWYRIRAGVGVESDLSAEVSVTTQPLPPPGPPMAPSWVSVVPSSSTDAHVVWGDDAWNENGYRIEHSLDGGVPWTSVGQVPSDAYESWVSGGTAERLNCYRVVAYNEFGESPSSSPACVTLIAGPSDAVVSAEGLFQWRDLSAYEDAYEIWYCGPEECAPLYSVPPNTETFADQWYYSGFSYWIVGVNDGGYSDFTAVGHLQGGTAATTAGSTRIREYLTRTRPRTMKPPR